MVHSRETSVARHTQSGNLIYPSLRGCPSPIVYQASDYTERKNLGYTLSVLNSHSPTSRGRVGTRTF